VLRANLVAAGIDPAAIDLIVISHFHPDHINGIKDKDNDLVFPNAELWCRRRNGNTGWTTRI
jgi:Metal-dependent hydrolases of the beta-lactamase superfamily II